jgi:transposase
MTISREVEGSILRYHSVEGWPVGTIATQLKLHHSTVERVLAQVGCEPRRIKRPSLIDPYRGFIDQTFEKFPTLHASRLFQMVKDRGYSGREDHFRHLIARFRPRPPAEAYLRLRTLPGEQAQVDWAHFGLMTVGKARRPLMGFVMVLSWSRALFVRFFLNHRLSNFLLGHQLAFEAFGGCAKVLLYDNLKSAVLERKADAIRFNPALLAFAAHYRYEPRPVACYRGNEKGRVERAIRYIRESFFAGRKFSSLQDLNAQVEHWIRNTASARACPEDKTMTVQQAFEQEKPYLLPLPQNPHPTDESVEVRVGKTPYVRFDLNDYSIPHNLTRRTLLVLANEKTVRILSGSRVVATHERSYDRGRQIEDPAHIEALAKQKKQARQHRGLDRLQQSVPDSAELFKRLAERGCNLGSATIAMLRLLDCYGSVALQIAVKEALERDAPHPNSVRHVLEQYAERHNLKALTPVALPDDPRVRNLTVKTHDLNRYDSLKEQLPHD